MEIRIKVSRWNLGWLVFWVVIFISGLVGLCKGWVWTEERLTPVEIYSTSKSYIIYPNYIYTANYIYPNGSLGSMRISEEWYQEIKQSPYRVKTEIACKRFDYDIGARALLILFGLMFPSGVIGILVKLCQINENNG